MRCRFSGIGLAACLVALAGAPALGWTLAMPISGAGSNAKVARGAGNAVHVTYYETGESTWSVYYRSRTAAGVWSAPEKLSSAFSYRSDVIEDGQGRPHVVFPQQDSDGIDLIHAYKDGSGWHISWLTNTSGVDEDEPRMGVDSLGRVHLVHTQANRVIYRTWSGSWSGATDLGACGNSYYQRPDISVDPSNNAHVVYGDDGHVYYRKYNGTSWTPTATIATTAEFCAFPKIAAPTANNVVMVTFDQANNGSLKYVYSNNGGSTWSSLTYLVNGHWPNMDADTAGSAHIAFHWLSTGATGYMRWNGSSWTAAESVAPNYGWQGWADIGVTADGVKHVVFDDNEWDPSRIAYVNSAPDVTPPGQALSFTVSPGSKRVRLAWTNPSDYDFRRTVVRVGTTGYPATHSDGQNACDLAGTPGEAVTYPYNGLANGQTCYFSAFTCDAAGNYSVPVQRSATPERFSLGEAKRMPDGRWVGLEGHVVTAIFPADTSFYIEEPDRSAGLRVAGSGAGLSIGSVVDIDGTVTTRMINGSVPAERQISTPSYLRIASGTPLRPLALQCLSVGGAAVPPYVPGVVDAVGANNMGLLVRIGGRVTMKIGSYLYVDDGSNIPDTPGRIGVMVRCPDMSIPAQVNDIVGVTGIVEGSVPAGWSANRRLVHIRDYGDLQVFGSVTP